MKKIISFLKLMRIKHYIKNILIFLPLIFSGSLFCNKMFIKSIIGFIVFSLVCSIVYTINDIKDIEKDKLHFKKKRRPLASGDISIRESIILIIILSVLIAVIIILNKFSLFSILLLMIYLVLNLLYSFGSKNIPIVDLMILASGFVIRVLFGASLIDVYVSNWLYLTIMAISFYLALGKRRNEIKVKKITREVLKYYTEDFLNKNMYMFLGMGIIFYSLWAIDSNTIKNTSQYLIWTIPIVIAVAMKYNMIIDGDSDGDPVEVILSDKILLILFFIYCCLMLFLVYII